MNTYEEELQEQFENDRRPESDGLDIKAYQEVFRVLEKEPGYHLSSTFAEKVVSQVVSRQQARQSKDYLWFGLGLLLILASSVATIMATGFRLDFGFLGAMSDYKGLAAFGISFVVFLNWLDRCVVRNQSSYRN